MNPRFNRIKIVLAEKNLSNKDLAAHLGMKDLAVSRWATNRSQPHLETLFRIAEFLKVDPRELIEGQLKIERPSEAEFDARKKEAVAAASTTAAKTLGQAGADFLKKMQAAGLETAAPASVYVLFEMMDLAAGTVALAGVWAEVEKMREEMLGELGEKCPPVAALQRTLDSEGQTNFVGPSGSIFLLFKSPVR